MKITPVLRAAAVLESEGWLVAKVRRLHGCQRRRQLLYGFADLLAIRPDAPTLAVSISPEAFWAANARRRLLEELPAALTWLASGNHLQVWSYHKRRSRWRLTRLPVTPEGGIRQSNSSASPTAVKLQQAKGADMPTVEKVVRNELLLKQARERSRLALAAAREALAAGDDPSDQEADYRAAERDVVILENRSAQLQARAKG